MRHTFEAHSFEPSFNFSCGINGCTSSFKLLSSYFSHLDRRHPTSHLEPSTDENSSILANSQDSSTAHYNAAATSYGDVEEVADACDQRQILAGGAKRSAALFLLTLKEEYRVTQTALILPWDKLDPLWTTPVKIFILLCKGSYPKNYLT